MADLRDRGQIILVAGFALAVTFVALALVVNSAIFTQNLSTRDDTTAGSNALMYRHEVERAVGDVIGFVNRNNDSNHATKVEDSIENLTVQGGVQNARGGRVVTIESAGSTPGSRLIQTDADRAFENASGVNDWRLADGVAVRAVEFNVTHVGANSRSSAFTFVVEDLSDSWELAVFNESAPDTYNVTVETGGGNTASCERTVPSGQFVIDVTGGTVAGEPCRALRVHDGDRMSLGEGVSSPYDKVRYERGDEIEGTYSMVIDDDTGEVEQNFDGDSSLDYEDAVYSLDVTYTYESRTVRYETTFTVAPGEPDD